MNHHLSNNNNILLLWVFSLSCLGYSTLQVYHISPDHSNCTVNKTQLDPCYNLSQLVMDNIISSSVVEESTVALLFLPGSHTIPESRALHVSNISEIVLKPWNEEQNVTIECEKGAYLYFRNINKFKMISLTFTSCLLQFVYEMNPEHGLVNITQCTFEDEYDDYAITLNSTDLEPMLNVTIANCTFLSNFGAIFAQYPNKDPYGVQTSTKSVHLQITDSLFQQHRNDYGTLCINIGSLVLDRCQFISNRANVFGAITAASSSLTLNNSYFFNNSIPQFGSAIDLEQSSAVIDSCHFVNNSGSAITIGGHHQVPQSYIRNSVFEGNHAEKGAALIISKGGVTFTNCQFSSNSALTDGGAIYCQSFSVVDIIGGYSISNSAENSGGFAYIRHCHMSMDNHFVNESTSSQGGAVYAHDSTVVLYGKSTLAHNTAGESGGALYLSDSDFILQNTDIAVFDSNAAADKGGAFFVSDVYCAEFVYPSQCFLYDDYPDQRKHMIFTNNSASYGSILYGGLLDRCFSNKDNGHMLGMEFIRNASRYPYDPLAITSDPVLVCLCIGNTTLDCTTRKLTLSKMKGQSFSLTVAVVDQDKTPKASSIIARYREEESNLGKGEGRQESGNCSRLSYHIFTSSNSATLVLQPEGYCASSNFSSVTVDIRVPPCSKGFQSNGDRCGCDERLVKHFNVTGCSIDSDTIQRKGALWLRYDERHLKVHGNCPLDYCNTTLETISLRFPEEQCADNRVGVLCGGCRDNYSITLGGHKCLQCISSYTPIWLVAVFAVAGVALVAFLLVCNLTVSHGTLNGLIFYANVVSITGLMSVQNCYIHPILSVFIAWVNLDFGVETCFYPGMDTYQKTWLQLVFPLYIWILVGAIILASRYSATAVKLFGMNNIAVLATLLLLSYTKILKTIITALNFTQVLQGSANDTSDPLLPYAVWTYDANIEYLKGKHVPLFAVGLALLIFLFLPYTLLLTFGQCIRSLPTERRCLRRWIHSTAFISIMDAYHSPYSNKHRYWTGLMLLTRCVLFLAFASNYNANVLLTNMYVTTIVLTAVIILKSCNTEMYNKPRINLLEIFFHSNLLILSATLYYLGGSSDGNDTICKCTYVSISISMAAFVGILAYHSYLQLKKVKPIHGYIITKWHARKYGALSTEEGSKPPPAEVTPANPSRLPPTSTTVEFRSELLAILTDEN